VYGFKLVIIDLKDGFCCLGLEYGPPPPPPPPPLQIAQHVASYVLPPRTAMVSPNLEKSSARIGALKRKAAAEAAALCARFRYDLG